MREIKDQGEKDTWLSTRTCVGVIESSDVGGDRTWPIKLFRQDDGTFSLVFDTYDDHIWIVGDFKSIT